MKFIKSVIQNFLIVGYIECRLDDKGLVLIQGENRDDSSQDSNGAGKSTIADAISWCLYGITARGETGDAVINRNAKKNCMVELQVRDGDEQYVIRRFRKDKIFKNQLRIATIDDHGNEFDLSKGTDKATQEVVNQVIGCSADVFNAAIYSGQEKMVDLPGMTDKHLKMLVEEAAGVDRLQAAYSVALSRQRELKSEYGEIGTGIAEMANQVKTILENIDSTKLDAKAWQVTHKAKIKETVSQLKEIKEQWEHGKEKLMEYHFNHEKLYEKLRLINEKLAGLDKEKKEEERLAKVVSSIENSLNRSSYELSAQTDKIRITKGIVVDTDKLIGTACGECGKKYTEKDIAPRKNSAREKISELIREYKSSKAAHETLGKQLHEAKEALDEYRSKMTDPSSEIENKSDTERKLKAVADKIDEIGELKSELLDIKDHLIALKGEENPYDKIIKRLLLDHEKALERKTKAEEKKRKLEDELEIAAATVEVFSPAGVRAYILDTVTPFLNSRTALYLGILTDGNITAVWSTLSTTAKGELREKFNIQVESKVGAGSFKGLSGGEKRKVRLACSMALQDLVSSRATKPIDLYIADEIDHALDESGLERLMAILDDKARTKGTALVISHNSLSDWIREHVTVVKESGYATLEGDALSA